MADDDLSYSTIGPLCPHCDHQHPPDEPVYFDEDTTSLHCEACGIEFEVSIFKRTSWTTRKAVR